MPPSGEHLELPQELWSLKINLSLWKTESKTERAWVIGDMAEPLDQASLEGRVLSRLLSYVSQATLSVV